MVVPYHRSDDFTRLAGHLMTQRDDSLSEKNLVNIKFSAGDTLFSPFPRSGSAVYKKIEFYPIGLQIGCKLSISRSFYNQFA